VEIDGVKVKEGHIIALLNGKLVLSTKNLEKGCLGLLKKIDMDDYELITLFYGDTMDPEGVEEIASKIRETYPDHEVEIQEGGQPHYQFIFAIE
jgi:dihydroxyacetone kinase-like predicted kinase